MNLILNQFWPRFYSFTIVFQIYLHCYLFELKKTVLYFCVTHFDGTIATADNMWVFLQVLYYICLKSITLWSHCLSAFFFFFPILFFHSFHWTSEFELIIRINNLANLLFIWIYNGNSKWWHQFFPRYSYPNLYWLISPLLSNLKIPNLGRTYIYSGLNWD